MLRALFLMLVLSLSGSAGAIDRGISGLWYNPAQTGHGFELTVVAPSTVAVTWYTYNSLGFPIWVAGVLTESSPGVLTGNVSYYQGMVFGQFSPSANSTYSWGTLRFTFSGCSSASVEYNGTLRYQDGSGFGAGVVQLQKLAGVQDVACGQTANPTPSSSLAAGYSGFIRSNASGVVLDAYLLLEGNGKATMMVPGNSAYFGTYALTSSGLAFSLLGQAVPGIVFANGSTISSSSGTATARAADFITGSYTGGNDTGTFTFTYEGASTRTPTLAHIAGLYVDASGDTTLSVTINSSGSFSGQDASGCRISGTLVTLGAALNGFSVTASAASCGPADGSYTGKAVVGDQVSYGDGRSLAVALQGSAFAFTGFLRRN